MIVAFILPKRFPRNNSRCDQQMNMIRHHDESMQSISLKPAFSLHQSALHNLGNFRTPKMYWSAEPSVEDAIHSPKSLTRRRQAFRDENPTGGKAAVQAKSHK